MEGKNLRSYIIDPKGEIRVDCLTLPAEAKEKEGEKVSGVLLTVVVEETMCKVTHQRKTSTGVVEEERDSEWETIGGKKDGKDESKVL